MTLLTLSELREVINPKTSNRLDERAIVYRTSTLEQVRANKESFLNLADLLFESSPDLATNEEKEFIYDCLNSPLDRLPDDVVCAVLFIVGNLTPETLLRSILKEEWP